MSSFQTPTVAKPSAGMGIGVFLLAGPVVTAMAGMGGHYGEQIGGNPGYWIGCYLAAVVSAALAGLIFARLFHSRPLFWSLGALGLFLGGHLTWCMLGGNKNESQLSGSDQFLAGAAAVVGMLLGFTAAMMVVSRQRAIEPVS